MRRSEKLLEVIREQEIKPVPKWYFGLKNGLMWAGFAGAVILGALAFSVILFVMQQTDFNVLGHLSHSRLELFLGLLPFLWILFLVVFLAIAFYSIQHSKRGYKFTAAKLAGFSAAFSILLGTLFFIGGGADQLEQAFAVQVELYESVQEKKMRLWSMPAEGYLSGEIEAVQDEMLVLKDFEDRKWEIFTKEAFIAPVVLLERGEKIKLIGTMEAEGKFEAAEIRPWGGRRQRMRRGRD